MLRHVDNQSLKNFESHATSCRNLKFHFTFLEMEIKCVNTRHLTRGSLKVRVVRVDSPTFFWVHLENSREDFEELLEDLTRRMTRRSRLLRHRPDHVLPDELVAVREGKGWQRGIVLKLERGDQVTVALRDWGRAIQRSVHDMYILEDRFRELEWQAIPCGLAHIRPIGARSRWPRKAKELTRLLLEKREGWMRILGSIRDEAAIIALELKRESEDEMGSLNDLLIGMGCAQYTDREIAAAVPGILD